MSTQLSGHTDRLTGGGAIWIGVRKAFGKSECFNNLVIVQDPFIDFGISGWKRKETGLKAVAVTFF